VSDLLSDSIFYWVFSSASGDAYYGSTVADTAAVAGLPEGAVIPSPYGPGLGFYTVTDIVDYPSDLSAYYGVGYYVEGATVAYSYYDGFGGLLIPTLYGSQGIPTGYGGVGTEYDYVVSPVFGGYDDFGLGGAALIA
jgi:hypothetical protein